MSRLNRSSLQALAAAVGVLVLASAGAAVAASGHAWHAQSTASTVSGSASDSASDSATEDSSQDPNEDPGDESSDSPSDSTDPTDAADPSDSTEPSDPSDPGTVAGTETGLNVASLHGLCRAFVVGNKAEHGHALSSPPFVALEAAAGGADQVEAYCASLFPPDATEDPTDGSTDAPTTDSAVPDSEGTHPALPTHPTHPTHPVHPAGGHGKPAGHVSHGHGGHGRGHQH
jgi:hypothetical protein